MLRALAFRELVLLSRLAAIELQGGKGADEESWMTANPGQVWASVDHGGFRGQPTPRKKKNFKVIINIIRINSHCGFRAPHPPRCARRAPHPLLRRLCLTSVPAVPPLCAGCAAPLCRLCRPSALAVPPAVPAVPPAVPAVPPAAPAVPPRCAGSAI